MFILSLFLACSVRAQTTVELIGADANIFFSESKLKKEYTEYVNAYEGIQDALQALYKKGYLAASIDSIWESDQKAKARIHVGKTYQWAQIRTTNIPPSLIQLSGYDSKHVINKSLRPALLSQFMEKMISYYENNGYPFAAAKLDSVHIHGNQVSAALTLKKGPLVKIDTILLNKEAGIHKNFITKYLNIKEGELYSENKIRKISQLLKELPFLEEAYPWKIYFGASETRLHLYLKNKSANRADVLIGLLPNNAEIGNRFLLTGDIKFAFVNALERGEKFEVNWQNLQFQSPRLKTTASYPYLFDTQIGISGTFDYYKKDTSFRTVNGELGFIYQFSAQEQLKAFYETGSTRLISINKSELLANRSLPANADIRTRSAGLAGRLSRTNYDLNPLKGWKAFIKSSASIRDFLPNATIEDTFDPQAGQNFSYLYDTINLRSYRFQVQADLEYFLPLGKRMTLASRYRGGVMFSEQSLYRNEIFQIGGFKILRGFDEGSLFVNQYHVATLEPRYLLSQNSYFFLFTDIAYIKRNYPGLNRNDNPYSLGLGMVFETKAGLFNISYAAGTLGNTGIQFRNSKIHFGYVSFF